MEDTGISHEIAALREQIAAAEAEIARLEGDANQHRKAGNAVEKTDLAALVEARDFMTVRLSRLESCKRTPDA